MDNLLIEFDFLTSPQRRMLSEGILDFWSKGKKPMDARKQELLDYLEAFLKRQGLSEPEIRKRSSRLRKKLMGLDDRSLNTTSALGSLQRGIELGQV